MEKQQSQPLCGSDGDNHSDEVSSSVVIVIDADEAPITPIYYKSVEQTFSQPKLLKMILDYGMRTQNGRLHPKNIGNFRLVEKRWNEAVSNKLLDNKKPMFRLKLDKNNSLLESQFVKDNGKLLDTFVDYWTAGEEVKKTVPTFRLELMKDYFRQENYDSLSNCLRKCGTSLVEIVMDVPENGGSLPGILSNINLPILRKLYLNFTGNRLETVGEGDLALTNHPSNITFLFQSLLAKNESLDELTLISEVGNNCHYLVGVEYISLPGSITSIMIDFRGAERILELLTRNPLPNLKGLIIGVSYGTSICTELLFRIFEKSRNTLSYLSLGGEEYPGPPRVPKLLRFPVMEKLEILEICRVDFELEMEHSPVEELFPKLEKLALVDQTPEMLQKWTTGSPCTSVETLYLELVDESKPRIPLNTLPMSPEVIQSIRLTFPHVCVLNLEICGTETSGLKCIFMEMRQLTGLHIYVAGTESICSSDHWDLVLIGGSMKFEDKLPACPWFGNQVTLDIEEEPSIRMLEGLTTFSLIQVATDGSDDPDDCDTIDSDESDPDEYPTNPLISNLAFVHAFLRMPNLKRLNFKGRFGASEEMTREWKKMGRTITYSK